MEDQVSVVSVRESVMSVLGGVRVEGARSMATNALDDAVASGDAKVSQAFKKAARSFEAAFSSMTGKKWRVKAGKDLFSATDGKHVVDIFWDWDPMRMRADVEIEGPKGYRSRVSMTMNQLGDMGRSGRNGESSALGLIMNMASRLGEAAESIVSGIVEGCGLREASDVAVSRERVMHVLEARDVVDWSASFKVRKMQQSAADSQAKADRALAAVGVGDDVFGGTIASRKKISDIASKLALKSKYSVDRIEKALTRYDKHARQAEVWRGRIARERTGSKGAFS